MILGDLRPSRTYLQTKRPKNIQVVVHHVTIYVTIYVCVQVWQIK
jgi:hypothetical protein